MYRIFFMTTRKTLYHIQISPNETFDPGKSYLQQGCLSAMCYLQCAMCDVLLSCNVLLAMCDSHVVRSVPRGYDHDISMLLYSTEPRARILRFTGFCFVRLFVQSPRRSVPLQDCAE